MSIAAFFTAFYMGRQILMVFFGEPRTEAARQAKESPLVMAIPLMILAFLSLFGGGLNLPFERFYTFGHWLESTLREVESLPLNLQVAGLSTVLALVGIVLAWYLFGRNPLKAGHPDPLKKPLGPIYRGMENKWYIDELYNAILITPYRKVSYFLADVTDWRFWHYWFHERVIAGSYNWFSIVFLNRNIDGRGIDRFANFLGQATKSLSATVRWIQNGFVRSYALSVLIGVVIILGYLIFR